MFSQLTSMASVNWAKQPKLATPVVIGFRFATHSSHTEHIIIDSIYEISTAECNSCAVVAVNVFVWTQNEIKCKTHMTVYPVFGVSSIKAAHKMSSSSSYHMQQLDKKKINVQIEAKCQHQLLLPLLFVFVFASAAIWWWRDYYEAKWNGKKWKNGRVREMGEEIKNNKQQRLEVIGLIRQVVVIQKVH